MYGSEMKWQNSGAKQILDLRAMILTDDRWASVLEESVPIWYHEDSWTKLGLTHQHDNRLC